MEFEFSTDKEVLKNLSQMGEHLKELKLKMLQAEEAFKQAKQAYEHVAMSVLPMEMFNAGVSALTLASGGTIQCKQSFHCSPNKNETDKALIAEWLCEHGGDYLVKRKATVDSAQIQKLQEAHIPYAELSDFNTNSLKSFLKDKLGLNGGVAEIQMDEIPQAIHFQELSIVDIQA